MDLQAIKSRLATLQQKKGSLTAKMKEKSTFGSHFRVSKRLESFNLFLTNQTHSVKL